MTGLLPDDASRPLAIVVARDGVVPAGGDEAAAAAGGAVLVVGSGTERAATGFTAATDVWHCDTGPALRPGALARLLAPMVAGSPLLVLPASPDGRDLAPRLAAELGRPLLAQAIRAEPPADGGVRAEVSRLDDRLIVAVTTDRPAVVTLVPGSRTALPVAVAASVHRLTPPPPESASAQAAAGTGSEGEAELIEILEPDPETMELAEAHRVLGAGAGLVPPGTDDAGAVAVLELLTRLGGRLGAATGATRVVTDAGWAGHERQIGTTGVTIDPDLYIAFGVSGAAQHTGGLGSPRHIISVNTDPSCPMTAMADLGLVTDARALLAELARRFGLPLPGGLPEASPGPAPASGSVPAPEPVSVSQEAADD